MCTQGVPFGATTGAVCEYDTYRYIQQRRTIQSQGACLGRRNIEMPVLFLAMETPPSSWSLPSSASGLNHLDAQQPCVWGVTTCQRQATALAAPILLTPVLLFAGLDRQSEAGKHGIPLTVQNITDVGDLI